MDLKTFIKQRPHLVWSTKDYGALSESAIVEAVLNYGTFQDVQTLISLLGMKKTASIFYEHASRKRVNYNPKIRNYFQLYFQKYA